MSTIKKLLCFGLLAGIFGNSFPLPTYARQSAGAIFKIEGSGNVVVIDTKTKERRDGKPEDEIFVGDKIVTKEQESVILVLREKSEIHIAPSSSFTVEEFKPAKNQRTVLNLAYGMLRALVKKSYEPEETFAVKTSNATMGVRGTEFVVENDPKTKETKVHTLQGKVAMGQSLSALKDSTRTVMIPAGQASFFRPGMVRPEAPKSFDQGAFRQDLQKRAPQIERNIGQPMAQLPTSLQNSNSKAINSKRSDVDSNKRSVIREKAENKLGKNQPIDQRRPGPGIDRDIRNSQLKNARQFGDKVRRLPPPRGPRPGQQKIIPNVNVAPAPLPTAPLPTAPVPAPTPPPTTEKIQSPPKLPSTNVLRR